ncbi:methyltransferase domain-containing protein [Patescibacteria group bacterium]|nr:methyltransferase domain-containing protein [Patescibacteria group bacterium]
MNRYHFVNKRYSTHRQIIDTIRRIIKDSDRVLDLGCNTGYLGNYIKTGDWVGIENDQSLIPELKNSGVYKEVLCEDINNFDFGLFKKESFDIIIMADILEHLFNPDSVMQRLKPLLKESGHMVISIPNIANFKIRLKLLFGFFTYTETGILDRTHVHFFEKHSVKKFIKKNGLVIKKMKFTSTFFGVIISSLSFLGPWLGHEIVIVAKKN